MCSVCPVQMLMAQSLKVFTVALPQVFTVASVSVKEIGADAITEEGFFISIQ